jgi:hypothetical protein
MKLYDVDFKPEWPVPCCLIIAANNIEEAAELAKETVKHTDIKSIKEVQAELPFVVKYDSGQY